MIKELIKIAEANPDGFTVKLPELKRVTQGYVSAYKETQNCFGIEGLKKAVKHAEENDNVVGGWLNEKNREFYFDSCKILENEEEAVEFGRENEQIAIFDLTNLRVIEL